MRINANIDSLNHTQNLYRLNVNTAQVSRAASETGENGGNTDKVAISPQGKAMSMMESMMKQKEAINQKKHELIEKTLESGGSLNQIQKQLEAFDESIEMIDEQISIMMEETLKDPEKEAEPAQKAEEAAPKTAEDAQALQLSGVAAIANSLESIKTVSSVKNRMEGRINVLKQQISQDSSHGAGLSKSDRKQTEISELREKIEDAAETIAETGGEVRQESIKLPPEAPENESAGEEQSARETAEAEA